MGFNGCAWGDGGELSIVFVRCDSTLLGGESVGIDFVPDLKWEGQQTTG